MTDNAAQRRTRDGIAGVKINEIEPGRAVPNIWENQLVEPWAKRKARLQAERGRGQSFQGGAI